MIVPDDVWHSRVWDYLRGALTDDHIGSRVPTTTCFEDLIHHWSQTREMLAEFLARTVIRMSWSLLRDRWKSCQLSRLAFCHLILWWFVVGER